MKNLSTKLLSRKLTLLVMIAIIPALALLLHSGIKQRRISIEYAKQQVFQLTKIMKHSLEDLSQTTEILLSTLSLIPAVQTMDSVACNKIFKDILKENPNFGNITLADLNGEVLASGKAFVTTNLADRKHFREALEKKAFAVGEYIVTRIGTTASFAFANPVFDRNGSLKAILTVVVDLVKLSYFHNTMELPGGSFISITDYQGIRLFFYPSQDATNPVGKLIKTNNWERAKNAKGPETFISIGSDGQRRMFAFEQIRLTPDDSPDLYAWAGIPEVNITGPANVGLGINILLMLMVTIISFFISRVIGNNTEALIVELETAIREIKTLKGILPICSFCKSIRNDKGYYEKIEDYIHKHSDADFSHTVCPTCMKEHYPEYVEEDFSEEP